MRKRNAVRAAAAALAAMMALTACGGGGGNETTAAAGGDTGSTAAGGDAAASGSGEVGKTDITVAMGADIVTLDPAGQQDTTTAVVIKHAYRAHCLISATRENWFPTWQRAMSW